MDTVRNNLESFPLWDRRRQMVNEHTKFQVEMSTIKITAG